MQCESCGKITDNLTEQEGIKICVNCERNLRQGIPVESYKIAKTTSKSEQGSPLLKVLGGLLLIAGAIIVTYYFYHFDTAVTVKPIEFMGETYGGGKVNNIGLLQDKQNGIIIGIAIAGAGLVCMVIGVLAKRR